jgi:hypothetical protein
MNQNENLINIRERKQIINGEEGGQGIVDSAQAVS